MKINQLKRLIKYLPDSFLEEFKDKDITTCWYASSGLDKRPMELLDYSHPDALTNEKVDVFFYTDIDFAFSEGNYFFGNQIIDFEHGIHRDYTNGIKEGTPEPYHSEFQKGTIDQIRMGYISNANFQNCFQNKFDSKLFSNKLRERNRKNNWKNANEIINNAPESISEKLYSDLGYQTQYITLNESASFDLFMNTYESVIWTVKHQRTDGTFFYTFYIDIDDHTFEQLLIQKKLKIDFAAHWGGWAGPGPELLGNLVCRYALGPITENEQNPILPDGNRFMPFTLKEEMRFNWRLEQDDERIFYSVHTNEM
jgi:hypothetical protein